MDTNVTKLERRIEMGLAKNIETHIDLGIKIRARRTPMSFGGDKIDLYAYQSREGGKYAAHKLEMTQMEKGCVIPVFVQIEQEESQVLMDDLWEAGIRPTEGSGSAGAMKAVQNHLSDLKTILFHKLGIKE